MRCDASGRKPSSNRLSVVASRRVAHRSHALHSTAQHRTATAAEWSDAPKIAGNATLPRPCSARQLGPILNGPARRPWKPFFGAAASQLRSLGAFRRNFRTSERALTEAGADADRSEAKPPAPVIVSRLASAQQWQVLGCKRTKLGERERESRT